MRRMPYDAHKLDELNKLFDISGNTVVFGGNVQADGDFLDHAGNPIGGNSITIQNLEAGNNITIQYYDESGTQVSDSIGLDETKTYNCNYFKIKCALSTVSGTVAQSGGCLYDSNDGWIFFGSSISVSTSYSDNILVHGKVKIQCSH